MAASCSHTRPQRIVIASVLLLIPSFFGMTGCKNRTEETRRVSGNSIPEDAGPLNIDGSRENWEYGVTNTRLTQYAGTMDVENRYTSTVIVSTDLQTISARCSGVVISPRVVLTAASCLCEPGNSVSCLDRAAVTTVIYGAVLDKNSPEDTTRMSFHGYEGVVRTHPVFKFVSDDAGSAMAANADLAVIVLDETVKEVTPELLMEQGDFQPNDPLIMAGYASSGAKSAVGGLYGIRYFRKNTVTQALAKDQGRVLYQQHGPFIYNGYAGGPCFREVSPRRLLVGIAGIGSDQELSFTSVPAFLDWVRAEVRQAATPPASNH